MNYGYDSSVYIKLPSSFSLPASSQIIPLTVLRLQFPPADDSFRGARRKMHSAARES